MSGRRSFNKQGSRIRRGSGQVFESKLLPDLDANQLEGRHLTELAELEDFFGMNATELAESVSQMFSQTLSPRSIAGTKSRPATAISIAAANDDGLVTAATPAGRALSKGSPSDVLTEPAAASPLASPGPSPRSVVDFPVGDGGMEPTRTNKSLFSPTSSCARPGTRGSVKLETSFQATFNSMESSGREGLSSRRQALDARRLSLSVATEALANITAIEMPRLDRQAHLERIHRPVTPRELAEAKIPRPLKVPPIFQRSPIATKEPHYSYFGRKLPGESPEHRRVMWGKAACTRKVYHFNEIVSSVA